MIVPGYCVGCRRVKQVRVSGSGAALSAARGGVMAGECPSCEEAREERELGARRGAGRGNARG
jgi:hypothetical protein